MMSFTPRQLCAGGDSGLPDHLITAYRRAQYRVAGLALRIGRRDRALDQLLAGAAFLITAANPASRRMPPAWNARMMRVLASAVGAAAMHPAESGAGKWLEPQILASLPAGRAKALGRRFRQMAIVRLRPGQAPALVPLRIRSCARPSHDRFCSTPC